MIGGYSPIHLKIDTWTTASSTNLATYIENFGPSDGWIVRQSAVSRVGATEGQFIDDTANGEILAAELLAGDGTLMINRDGGTWFVVELTEADGNTYLFDTQFQVSVDHGLLEYRRYWAAGAVAIEPVAYRLAKVGASCAKTTS